MIDSQQYVNHLGAKLKVGIKANRDFHRRNYKFLALAMVHSQRSEGDPTQVETSNTDKRFVFKGDRPALNSFMASTIPTELR